MSLFWDDIVKTEDAQMSGLRRSKYACVSVWIYCIIWFFVQDVAKVIGERVGGRATWQSNVPNLPKMPRSMRPLPRSSGNGGPPAMPQTNRKKRNAEGT